jgi:hypothetical protein
LLDVVVQEKLKGSMEIPEHPVERGAKISDHAWRKPNEVTMESIVDAPTAMDSWQALNDLMTAAEPFDLVSGLMIYPNMLIQTITATRDQIHSRVLWFEAELKEVIIVSTESGQANDDESKTKGKSGDKAGKSSATKADAAKTTVERGEVQARTVTQSSPGFDAGAGLTLAPGSIP